MNIVKIADGAYFVPAYSENMITPAYDTRTTIQSLGPGYDEDAIEKPTAPAKDENDRSPIYIG